MFFHGQFESRYWRLCPTCTLEISICQNDLVTDQEQFTIYDSTYEGGKTITNNIYYYIKE